ncbi:MAG: hypothetical protein ACJ740_16975 [Gaiellales bacterium]
MTVAIVMPVTPIRPPAKATRARRTDPSNRSSALASTSRIVAANGRNTKPARSAKKAAKRCFISLSFAQFVQS